MLNFAAIVPHSPLLLPEIGKENLENLKKTINGFKELEYLLYASKVETIIIISPHGFASTNYFNINLNEKYQCNLKEFGDFEEKKDFKGDIFLINELVKKVEDKSVPVNIITEEEIDYGTSVPLLILTKDFPADNEIKIIPLNISGLNLQAHYQFGKYLKRFINKSNKRIAVLASANLSHSLTEKSPAGFNSYAKNFDDKIISALKDKNKQTILKIDNKLVEQANECGLKSIVILLGILDLVNYQPQLLSYEFPFGVGYLVMNFKLK